MNDGILLIDKPMGMTSHDVVGRVRRLYGTRQVGHTGTLDPMATGLLVVLVGRAVKASEYATAHDKSYEAVLRLGIETDTEDLTGTVLAESEAIPSTAEVLAAANTLQGEILQVPPMYSALKRGGEKLCDLARRGETVAREARPVTVYSLEAEPCGARDYRLQVSCSKGTYIRTLCADLGRMLGCGGAMASLRRTAAGGFSLSDAVTLAALDDMTEAERQQCLRPVEELFSACPILRLPPFFARLAEAGNEIYLRKLGLTLALGERVRLYDTSFFSLGEVREYPNGPAVKPIKKFRL